MSHTGTTLGRHPGLRRGVQALLALSVLVLGGAAALPVLTGRTESPRYSLEAAGKAIQAARSEGASRWAPDALMQAESAYQVAMTEHRLQEARFFAFRNFATARAGLRIAEEKAWFAAGEAARTFRAASRQASESIYVAEQEVARADSIASSLHLDPVPRRQLQRSRIRLHEARNLLNAGEPMAARERADEAAKGAFDVRASAAHLASRYTDPGTVRAWRRWVDETVAQSRESGTAAVVVLKEQHVLHLYVAGRLSRSYRAEMGYNSVLTKVRAGDGSTPEGRYRITAKKGAGQSTYYKALLLNYPNDEDRARFEKARRSGAVPRWASPGGLIEIHGEGGRGKDWTRGCVALTNADMDELFARVGVGTPVTIVGGDGRGGVFTDLARGHAASAAAAAGAK